MLNYAVQLLITFLLILVFIINGNAAITISGKATQFGKDVRFKRVFVTGAGIDTSTLTDNNGNYTLQVTPKTTEGVLAVFMLNCVRDTHNVFKEFHSHTQFETINFNLCAFVQSTTVRGNINYNGKPLPNVTVKFSLNSPYDYSDSAVTDLHGNYLKTLGTPNAASGIIYTSINQCDDQQKQLSKIYNPEDTSVFNFNYCPNGNFQIFTGRVVNSNINVQANDFKLQLFQYNEQTKQLQFLEEINSKYIGTYRFLLNKSGKFILKAIPKNGNQAAPAYHGGGLYWNKASVIELSNDTVFSLDIPVPDLKRLEGTYKLTGSIIDSRNSKQQTHAVYLLKDGNLKAISTCQNNQFEIANIPDGDYIVYTDVVGLPTDAPELSFSSNNLSVSIAVSNKEVTYDKTLSATIDNDVRRLSIFPNPFNEYLTLQIDNQPTRIEIVDIQGNIVFKATHEPNSASTIKTEHWQRGVYIVNLIDEKGLVRTQKLVK